MHTCSCDRTGLVIQSVPVLVSLVSGGVATRTGGKFDNVVVGLGGASGSDIRATGPNVGLQRARVTQDDGPYCTTHRHSPPAQLVRVRL